MNCLGKQIFLLIIYSYKKCIYTYVYIYMHIYIYILIHFFFLWLCGPTRAMASSFMRFIDHTQRRTTVGMAPLDE